MSLATINLLPPEKKKALRTGFIMAYAQTMAFFFFIIAAFVSAMFLSVRVLLQNNYAGLTAQANGGADESDKVAADIEDINAYLRRVEARQKKFTPWSDVTASIVNTVPAGIMLENIDLRPKDSRILMRGMAADRNDVLELYNRLKALPFVTDLSNPLSNLLQRKDVRFEFDMKYAAPKPPAPSPAPAP